MSKNYSGPHRAQVRIASGTYAGSMSAASAIERILERSGSSKTGLSRRSGVSRAQIDTCLKGSTQPSVAQLGRLGAAARLRLDLSWTTVPGTSAEDDPS